MKVGSHQVCITPPVGTRLCGFMADRPAESVLDDLFVRAIFLVDGPNRLLWLHADLIGLGGQWVHDMKSKLAVAFGLSTEQVMISCTHTHSGPATVFSNHAGDIDEPYLSLLSEWMLACAGDAMADLAEARVVCAAGPIDLAIDRRHGNAPSPDNQATVLGFRKANGDYAGLITNYPMHPVVLGYQNRAISADYPGALADELRRNLPGEPVVLATNGACGEIDPPGMAPSPELMRSYGRMLASRFRELLNQGEISSMPMLATIRRSIAVQLEMMGFDQMDRRVAAAVEESRQTLDSPRFIATAEAWRRTMQGRITAGERVDAIDMELLAIRIGPLRMIGVAAEAFSRFALTLRERFTAPLCVVGYANGMIGYLPSQTAYEEGGYEVTQAYLFYNSFPPRRGELERAVDQAADMIASLD